mmetsp:Transcript_28556/g.70374  ORF Transcript_28556/g.70374 Transcript_28556/m.70374 type:complete len:409 (-) Transcript_28556:94-1320(-)
MYPGAVSAPLSEILKLRGVRGSFLSPPDLDRDSGGGDVRVAAAAADPFPMPPSVILLNCSVLPPPLELPLPARSLLAREATCTSSSVVLDPASEAALESPPSIELRGDDERRILNAPLLPGDGVVVSVAVNGIGVGVALMPPRPPKRSMARTALTAFLNGLTMSFTVWHPAISAGVWPAALVAFTASGLPFTSISSASIRLEADARWRGVFPVELRRPMSAPLALKNAMMSAWPRCAATCTGVAPSSLVRFTLAPVATSILTMAKCPLAAARCSAVSPLSFVTTPMLAPAPSRIFTMLSSAPPPLRRMAHAQCSAVHPASSTTSTSTFSCSTRILTISTKPFSAATCRGVCPKPSSESFSWKSRRVGTSSGLPLACWLILLLLTRSNTRRVSPLAHAACTSFTNSSWV